MPLMGRKARFRTRSGWSRSARGLHVLSICWTRLRRHPRQHRTATEGAGLVPPRAEAMRQAALGPPAGAEAMRQALLLPPTRPEARRQALLLRIRSAVRPRAQGPPPASDFTSTLPHL